LRISSVSLLLANLIRLIKLEQPHSAHFVTENNHMYFLLIIKRLQQ
jgi:hypothetical protein